MGNAEIRVAKLVRQQAAIATFGGFALREHDLRTILMEAARVCAIGLDVPYCKICRYRARENDFIVEAGYGWRPGVIGQVVSRVDDSSPQGRAFVSGEPRICPDLRDETAFDLPALYAEHGVLSTIDVIIKGAGQPYGVLEIDNDEACDYDPHDIDFLTSFANVLAEAVGTAARLATQRAIIDRMRDLVEEKDRLLDQKRILGDELQHRVRNNLQLVSGMLTTQMRETADEGSRKGLRAIGRRVTALAEVHEHLLGRDLARSTNFGSYVSSLCRNLDDMFADHAASLICDCQSVTLDLDTVTALGIIVTEVVANSYDHAFDGADGATITVAVRAPLEPGGVATLSISDNGKGFEPAANGKRHGLGLVRRLVEQIGATATLVSTQGTTWIITFPTRASAEQGSRTGRRDEASPTRPTRRTR